MPASARTYGLPLAASLGLHGLFLLLAAWVLAVSPVLRLERPRAVPEPEEVPADGELTSGEAEVAVIFTAPEEPPPPPDPRTAPNSSGKATIIAREDQPSQAPLDADTPFISSQNMRAANAGDAVAGADPRKFTQDGFAQESISLTSRNFSPGSGDSPPPPASPEPVNAPSAAEPRSPEAQSVRPPDAPEAVRTSDPLAPAPAVKPSRAIAVRETPPETLELPRPERASPAPKPLPAAQSPPGARPKVSAVKTKSIGALSGPGEASSVDARDTPEGRYNSLVYERIGLLWNTRLSSVRGVAGLGTVEVDFEIDPAGRVSNVRLVDPGKANPVLEDVCLTSIIKARLPAPPEELLRELRDPLSNGKIRRRFTFHRL